MEQPNIILFIADQMRGDCLGCAGHPAVRTPNIDFLASRGSLFQNAYSAVPSCLPARAILWTGQDQWHTGILGMGWGQGPIPDDYPHTLAGELRTAGYRTHLVGKGHFTPQRASMGFETTELDESGRTLPNGFEDEYRSWFREHAPAYVTPDDHGVFWNSWHARPWHTDEALHPTAWTGTRAINFLENRDRSRPFFLNVSFARPHSPYVPPRHLFDYYSRKQLPAPVVGEWADMHDVSFDAMDPNAWRGTMDSESIHLARAGYYGEISFIDQQVGRILNQLQRFDPEAYRNTWFIFVSDHGDMQGDHNLWRKTYAYEGSTRIPFVVMPPLGKREPGRQDRSGGSMISEAVGKVDQVVELRDVMPTVLDAVGLPTPATVDGMSVLPLLAGRGDSGRTGTLPNWRQYIHGEHCRCYHDEAEMQYVTDGKRKFVWLPRIDVRQFFDLEQDPGEIHDLYDDSSRTEEVREWEGFLAAELEARECGWARDGRLTPPGYEPLVSPWKERRRSGAE
jgi:arylsulfatase